MTIDINNKDWVDSAIASGIMDSGIPPVLKRKTGIVVNNYDNPNEVYYCLYGKPAPYFGADGKPNSSAEDIFKNTGLSFKQAQILAGKAVAETTVAETPYPGLHPELYQPLGNGGWVNKTFINPMESYNPSVTITNPADSSVKKSDIANAYIKASQKGTMTPELQQEFNKNFIISDDFKMLQLRGDATGNIFMRSPVPLVSINGLAQGYKEGYIADTRIAQNYNPKTSGEIDSALKTLMILDRANIGTDYNYPGNWNTTPGLQSQELEKAVTTFSKYGAIPSRVVDYYVKENPTMAGKTGSEIASQLEDSKITENKLSVERESAIQRLSNLTNRSHYSSHPDTGEWSFGGHSGNTKTGVGNENYSKAQQIAEDKYKSGKPAQVQVPAAGVQNKPFVDTRPGLTAEQRDYNAHMFLPCDPGYYPDGKVPDNAQREYTNEEMSSLRKYVPDKSSTTAIPTTPNIPITVGLFGGYKQKTNKRKIKKNTKK
jgi:hypothetical protein